MSMLSKNPVFPALILTGLISGFAMVLFGMPGMAMGDSGSKADLPLNLQEKASAAQGEPVLKDLLERIERLEGELSRVRESSHEPQVMAMLEGFRTEIEEFREQNSGVSMESEPMGSQGSSALDIEAPEVEDWNAIAESEFIADEEPVLHEQVFSFTAPVIPEAIAIIQGAEVGHPIFVEVMDRHGNWIEIYSMPNPQGEPSVETWIECPDAPMTEHVRVIVEGGWGIETVAAEKSGDLYWTTFTGLHRVMSTAVGEEHPFV